MAKSFVLIEMHIATNITKYNNLMLNAMTLNVNLRPHTESTSDAHCQQHVVGDDPSEMPGLV